MMNSHGMIILFMIVCSIWTINVHGQNLDNDSGWISDGKTDNKQVLENEWKKACETPGGTVSVPKGTYLVSSGNLQGPCKGPTKIIIDGTLMAPSDFNEDQNFWLNFNMVDGLTLSGTGTLDGNGASAWSICKGASTEIVDGKPCPHRPTTLKLTEVKNAQIQGISFVNSKMFHLNIQKSQNVNVNNVHITAPEDSPNTDGIHVSQSNYVNIIGSFIGTGDDCVSLGPGSRNVNITGLSCGPGHGISIGSLGKYKGEEDVSGITVRNCNLTKTTNGLRIKTFSPSLSSNIVSDVTYSEINLNSVKNPIIIDQQYCPTSSKDCRHETPSTVQIKGVKYVNVRGSSSMATAVNFICSKSNPCQNINLAGVKITYNGNPTTATCTYGSVEFEGSGQVPSSCSQ